MEAQLAGIEMLSLPGLWGRQKLGGRAPLEASLLFACRWAKFCPAGVQSGTLTGRLPSTTVF